MEGRNVSQHNYDNIVREVFPALLSDSDVMNGVGSVHFVQKDKKNVAKLFLRQGNVYGVENPNVKLDLAARLTTSKMASAENIATIRKSRQSIDKVVENALAKQYVKQADMTNLLKEHFLGAIDDLYAWEEVNVEWHSNEQYNDITVPQVSLSRLIDIASNRYQHVVGQAQEWNFNTVGELLTSEYFITGEVNANDKNYEPLNKVILTATDKPNILSVAKEAGVPPFVIIQSLIALEKNKLVSYSEETLKTEPAVLETIEDTPAEEVVTVENNPALAGKHLASEKKGTTQMTYPSSTPNNFDVVTLVKQLKEGLEKQQTEIAASDKRLLDYNQEISSLQAQIASLQVRAEAEEAAKKDLRTHHTYALQQIKELGLDE